VILNTLTSQESPRRGIVALISDDGVRRLFQQLVEKGAYSFSASIDERGISYPELSRLLPALTKDDIEAFVGRLREAGVFEAKLLDKLSVCPVCSGTKSFPRFDCPRCYSFDVGRALIIEHIRCGYVGSEDNFRRKGEIVCPKCSSELKDVDFRKIGTAYQCNSCGSRFQAPKVSNRCASCGNVFTYKDAKYVSVYSYTLSEAAKEALARDPIQRATFVNYLKSRGFSTTPDQKITGKSKEAHSFDLVARRGDELVVADFDFEATEEKIIALFAKKYDVTPSLTVYLSIKPASEELEKVSGIYDIHIFSSKEDAAVLGRELDALLGMSRQVEPAISFMEIKPEMRSEPNAPMVEEEKRVEPVEPVSVMEPRTVEQFESRTTVEPAVSEPAPEVREKEITEEPRAVAVPPKAKIAEQPKPLWSIYFDEEEPEYIEI
jgi:hypothetical protein